MDADSKLQDRALSLLNEAIKAMNLAKELSTITPATAVFCSVIILLTIIRDSMVNRIDYVALGLACADACRVLYEGIIGKKLDDLGQPAREAIARLAATVAGVRGKVVENLSHLSHLVPTTGDKDVIATWKPELDRVLQVLTARPRKVVSKL